jgi:hypothetical protein
VGTNDARDDRETASAVIWQLAVKSSARLPYDTSAITDQLFIAARPRAWHVEDLRGLGVDLVLSMTVSAPPRFLAEPPFQLLRLPTVDFWFFPIPLRLLRRGVAAALPVLERGGRVLVHCRGGRHRSVVMAACILVAMGMTADQAMDIITAHRAIADPHAWHMEPRIRAFERDWLRRKSAAQN